jgi:hypothetical protein
MTQKEGRNDNEEHMSIKNKQKNTRDQGLGTRDYVLSWGYWFGSRTQGLLVHPYITMREIVREQFLRPLTVVPVVMWVGSWIIALVLARVGLMFGLQYAWWAAPVGKTLVFLWMWMGVFLAIWQLLLGYLYVRFRLLSV